MAFEDDDLNRISLKQIQQYICNLQTEQYISASYQKQILASITKFYLFYFNRMLNLAPLYPHRKAKPLPKYLTLKEVKRLLQQCSNLKHFCIIKILYGCGLRVSEVASLKISEVDSLRMCILVRTPKGQKDREVPLPKSLLQTLRLYAKDYQPENFLFEGQTKRGYSIKSIQNFVKKYARQAKIRKHVSPHILRHSYAVHQFENGIDIRYIQEVLGHNSIKTTELYTQVTKVSNTSISNPLDQL